jgi:putative transcriptional regulator
LLKDSNQTKLIEILFIGIARVLNIPDIVSEEESEEFFRTISYNVKRIRNTRGISQLEVALSIGQKSSGFYANTENFKHGKHFNLLHLFKLSKLFDVDISEFFKPIK